MFSPLISVIIPTYNRYDLLLEAIASVKNQTYKNVELIIVDDGSTDKTCRLQSDKSVIYLKQDNKGPAAARNTGAKIAHGEWLAFLDSDDLWHQDKLQKQLNFIKNNSNCQIIYTDEIWFRKGIRVNKKNIHKKYAGWIYPYCLKLCIVGFSTLLITKYLWNNIGGLNETFPVAEDYDLWLRLSAKYEFNYIDEQLITKRGGREDQLSISFRGIDKYRIIALQKMMQNNNLKAEWKKLTCEELLRKCKIYKIGCEKHGKDDEIKFCENIIRKYTNQ
ncbi:MAG: glycosyltransferase family 2 protein [Chlamydiae bacterium]|nr:MAG: glycosyltransferase family 2 protein [Chlamydiota bacterium]